MQFTVQYHTHTHMQHGILGLTKYIQTAFNKYFYTHIKNPHTFYLWTIFYIVTTSSVLLLIHIRLCTFFVKLDTLHKIMQMKTQSLFTTD